MDFIRFSQIEKYQTAVRGILHPWYPVCQLLLPVALFVNKPHEFDALDQNLNGDNEYKFSVFASHRESIQEALKALVLNGTAQAVSYNEGLAYIITPEGEDFCQSLSSTYAKEYRKAAQAVIKAVGKRSERATIDAIYKLSAKSFRGGDNE